MSYHDYLPSVVEPRSLFDDEDPFAPRTPIQNPSLPAVLQPAPGNPGPAEWQRALPAVQQPASGNPGPADWQRNLPRVMEPRNDSGPDDQRWWVNPQLPRVQEPAGWPSGEYGTGFRGRNTLLWRPGDPTSILLALIRILSQQPRF